MPISFTCSCSKNLRIRDESAGRKVRCPGCGMIHSIPAQPGVARAAEVTPTAVALPARARLKTPAFPILGAVIGWAAVLVGGLMIAGGIAITVIISDGGFKPAGLIVFVLPGLLWALCGGLLLGLRRRFVYPFWIFLVLNLLGGVFLTTQAGSLGGRGDARIFAMVGMGFLLGAIFFQLFHGFLMRDLRRQAAATVGTT